MRQQRFTNLKAAIVKMQTGEDMKNEVDKKDKKTSKNVYHNTKAMLMIRVVIGGFILYLAYSILGSLNDSVGNDRYVMIAFSGLFIVAGLFIVGSSLLAIYKKQYSEAVESGSDEDVVSDRKDIDSDMVDLFSKEETGVNKESQTQEESQKQEEPQTQEETDKEIDKEIETDLK